MSARNNILNKLKKQVAGADYDKLPQEPTYPYCQLDTSQQYARFVELLQLNQAKVIETSREQLPLIVCNEMKSLEKTTLLYGKNTAFSQYIELTTGNVELHAFEFELDKAHKTVVFEKIDAGITTSDSAIAALGSIVLWPDENEPRSLSLVPEVHFVIVERSKIYADFPSLIKARNWAGHMPTNVLLISGPSKTGDIQQTMAFGAHGPKHLIVLLV